MKNAVTNNSKRYSIQLAKAYVIYMMLGSYFKAVSVRIHVRPDIYICIIRNCPDRNSSGKKNRFCEWLMEFIRNFGGASVN